MCHTIRCEICGEAMYVEEYFQHMKDCKPELEKVEVTIKTEKR